MPQSADYRLDRYEIKVRYSDIHAHLYSIIAISDELLISQSKLSLILAWLGRREIDKLDR